MHTQRTPRVTVDPATLTPAQLDGTACVVCGIDYLVEPIPHVPVGIVDGGQVFACTTCAALAEAGGTR